MLGGTTLFGLGDIANSVHCLIQELENGNEIKQDDWNMIYYFLGLMSILLMVFFS